MNIENSHTLPRQNTPSDWHRSRKLFSRHSSRSISSILLASALLLVSIPKTFVKAAFTEPAQVKIITTIAGGAFGASAPAKEGPLSLPIGVARDTQGRGIFFIDDISGDRLLRFLNTTANSLTFAGVVIPAGHVGTLAGGGNQDPVDGASPLTVYLGGINGIVVHPSGNLVFFGLPILNSANVFALNLTTQNITFADRPFPTLAGKLGVIAFAALPDMRTLLLRNDRFYTISTCCGSTASPKVFKMNPGSESEVIAGGGNPTDGNGDGGPATQAKLVNPTGIAFDSEGNLLIAEGGSSRVPGAIRKVNTEGNISTLLGDLSFVQGFPVGITIDPNGIIYLAIGNGQRVLRVTSGGSSTPIAGDGSGFACTVQINPTCGDGGPATSALLNFPGSATELSYQTIQMSADANGLFVPDAQRGQDTGYAHIRYINRSSNPLTIAGTTIAPLAINSIAGSGVVAPYDGSLAQYADLKAPHGVVVDANDNLFISDTLNHRLRFVNRGTTPITLFSGTPSSQVVQAGAIATLNKDVGEIIGDDRITTAFFDSLQGLARNANGIFIADAQNGTPFPAQSIPSRKSGLIRFLNTSASTVTFYPGSASPILVPPGQVKVIGGRRAGQPPEPTDIGDNGPATSAVIFTGDVAVDAAGNVYVADYQAGRLRRINANTGIITTVLADLNKPSGVAVDPNGRVLVADTYNNRVMRQNAPASASFSSIGDASLNPPIQRPRDMAIDSTGKIYVVSTGTNRVLELTAPSNALGTTAPFAGSGAPGFAGDGAPAVNAQMSLPNQNQTEVNQVNVGIVVLKNDAGVVFADTVNDRIRLVAGPPIALAVSANAASFSGSAAVAPQSIVAVFGINLATGTELAATNPLPTSLLGTTIKVKDSIGTERLAPLFFVSTGQCNYQMPLGTALGTTTVTVTSGDGKVSAGTIQVEQVGPGVFSAASNGSGAPAAYVIRVRGTQQTIEQIVQYNPQTQVFEHIPVDLGPAGDECYLILFGTGIRFRSALGSVVIRIGGRTHTALYAGEVDGFVGLDQLNPSPLRRELTGMGIVNIEVTIDGRVANITTVSIK